MRRHPRDLAGVTCSRCLRGELNQAALMAHWRAGHCAIGIRARAAILGGVSDLWRHPGAPLETIDVRKPDHLTAARRRRRVLSLARA